MHCIISIVFYELYSMHYNLFIVFYPLYCMHCIVCIVFYALYSMNHILCIVFFALYSMHCILSIDFYALYSMHCILFTLLSMYVELTLKLVVERPTDRRTLSSIELLSQLKIRPPPSSQPTKS